jgi:sRNA-binding protein
MGRPQREGAAGAQGEGTDGKSPAYSRPERKNLAEAVITLLAERFPKTFFVFERRRKPLKVGIHLDILAALAGTISPRDLGNALRFYVGNAGYLRAMLCGAYRYDLAGQPAGVVDRDQEIAARGKLAAIAAKRARREQEAAKQKAAAATAAPKRSSLADLKAAARARAAAAQKVGGTS